LSSLCDFGAAGDEFLSPQHPLRGADKVEDSVDRTSVHIEQAALLTETESVKRVGVSLSTFRGWRWKGIGPRFFLLGGILRYESLT